MLEDKTLVDTKPSPENGKKTNFFSVALVGGMFTPPYNRSIGRGLSTGSLISYTRQPDNVHDKNAILISTLNGVELGYVAKDIAKDLALLMDAGVEYDVYVGKKSKSKAYPFSLHFYERG